MRFRLFTPAIRRFVIRSRPLFSQHESLWSVRTFKEYAKIVFPYATLFTSGIFFIQYLRVADLYSIIGTWGRHEERKQVLRIRSFLTDALGRETALSALLCEVALWYAIVSPTCRLDNYIFELINEHRSRHSFPTSPHILEGISRLQAIVEEVEGNVADGFACSRTDIMHIAICVAMESIGGPRLKLQIGRKDVYVDDAAIRSMLERKMQENTQRIQSASSVEDWFLHDVPTLRRRFIELSSRNVDEFVSQSLNIPASRKLAKRLWTDEYFIALYGGFRAFRPEVAVGNGSPEALLFSNRYFSSVLKSENEILPHTKDSTTTSFQGTGSSIERAWNFFRIKRSPSDTVGAKQFPAFDAALLRDKLARDWIQVFALDEECFFRTFAGVFTWLLERGHDENELVDLYYKD